MLTITKLRGAEYLLRSVADGVEDYFMGAGEAPGVWHGRWADRLGLNGVVEAAQLRALVEGEHPTLGFPLLSGHRERVVKALDLTLSAPKSVSLLWAFGDPAATAEVSIAVSVAATTALDFLEARAAVTRRQVDGVRRQAGTRAFAVAMFTHRTSRAGDPQLHVHCLVPNVVARDDGAHVAIDAGPIHEWLKASGTVFQAELQRQLTDRLGLSWGPERNGCRELLGFNRSQLRGFSKRTLAIEAALEAGPEAVTAKERMRADDRASLATRDRKDRTLTPEVLRDRWADEATRAGIDRGEKLLRTIQHQATPDAPVDRSRLHAALVDPDTGLCATRARFGQAHVVERVAALAAGRWTTAEIEALAAEFLATDLVVRLTPSSTPGRRRPAQWSTVEHRRLEDRVLAQLDALRTRAVPGVDRARIHEGIGAAQVPLGEDQTLAVATLAGPGAALRVVLAPAGHGKTALTTTAASIVRNEGRSVVALAATNKAVAELRAAGLDASTIARWRLDGASLTPGAAVVLDEVSQVSTRDAAAVLDAVTATPGASLWCLGDEDQGRSVAPGGLAAELAHLADHRELTAAELTVNRRQHDPDEQAALVAYRAGDLAGSQATRASLGWEHSAPTSEETRNRLAAAAVVDICDHGPAAVAVLAVSHVDCEDLADRIRRQLRAIGRLSGPEMAGPAWGPGERRYAEGDRILLHVNCRLDGQLVHNGTTGQVTAVANTGLRIVLDDGRNAILAAEIVAGTRPDGTPNLSHAWARTVDGAQGGTWEHVHLLATPNVDRHTLYVGQSRGRYPTHTWNTIPAMSDEAHGNVVTDPRIPDEIVLGAAARIPDHAFAAWDDPHVLDRRLRAERDEHALALAAGPTDRRIERDRLARYVDQLDGDARSHADALAWAAKQARASGGPHLRRQRREGHRADLDRHDNAEQRLTDTQTDLRTARAQLRDLDSAVDQRRHWERTNQWRHDEIARIDTTLEQHWAEAVLAAAHDGQPLAYGLDRLRSTSAVLAATPADGPENLAVIEAALAQERTARLQQIAAGRPAPAHLTTRLGPLSGHPAARDTWLGLALDIESRLDSWNPVTLDDGLRSRLERVGSRDPLHSARSILDASQHLEPPSGPDGAGRWRDTAARATEAHRARELERSRSLDHDLGIFL